MEEREEKLLHASGWMTWRAAFSGAGVVRTRRNERGCESEPRSFFRVRTTPMGPAKPGRQVTMSFTCRDTPKRSWAHHAASVTNGLTRQAEAKTELCALSLVLDPAKLLHASMVNLEKRVLTRQAKTAGRPRLSR